MISTQKQSDTLKLDLYLDMLAYYKMMCKHEDREQWSKNLQGYFIGKVGLELIYVSIVYEIPISIIRKIMPNERKDELYEEALRFLNNPPCLKGGIVSPGTDYVEDGFWYGFREPTYTWSCVDKTTSGKDESFVAKTANNTIYF